MSCSFFIPHFSIYCPNFSTSKQKKLSLQKIEGDKSVLRYKGNYCSLQFRLTIADINNRIDYEHNVKGGYDWIVGDSSAIEGLWLVFTLDKLYPNLVQDLLYMINALHPRLIKNKDIASKKLDSCVLGPFLVFEPIPRTKWLAHVEG